MNDNEVFNDLIVVKRSGQRVSFNGLKIAVAIKKAFDNTNNSYDEKTINCVYEDTLKYIFDNYQGRKTINVEDIQDIIENILKKEYDDVFLHFSEYRMRRTESRKVFATKQQHKFVKAIEKIGLLNWRDSYPSKVLDEMERNVALEYAKAYVLDSKYVRSCEEGKIFVQNLPYLHLGKLLNTHIRVNYGHNKHFIDDIINNVGNIGKELNGEICLNNFDTLCSKYYLDKFKIIFEKYLHNYFDVLGYKEFIDLDKVSECITGMISIDNDLTCFKGIFLSESSFNVLHKAYHDSFDDLLELMNDELKKLVIYLAHNNSNYSISFGLRDTFDNRLVVEILSNIIDNMPYLKNVAIIYKVKKDMPKYLLDCLSNLLVHNKNVILNFNESNLNKDSTSNVEYFSDGLRIFENINDKSLSLGRMNIANTSINMARLGLKYKSMNRDFYQELNDLIEFVKNQQLFVFETVGNRSKQSYEWLFYGNILDDDKLEAEQKVRRIIRNGTLNINLIGLKECAYMIDPLNYCEVMLKIIKYIDTKVKAISQETKLNFTLSVINYEQDAKYFIKLDKTIFGLVSEVTKKDVYENPFVNDEKKGLSLNEISKLERNLNGGSITNVMVPKNISLNKILSLIQELLDNDQNLVKIRRRN